jgi:allantoin racemase
MRIWHQSLTVLNELPAYQVLLDKHIKSIVRPDTEVVLHGMMPGTYATDFPLSEIQYPALAHYHFTQILNAAITAEKEGFDAFAMCFLCGPLLTEIRSVVDIPVINYGETAFHFASFYGQKFGVVRFLDTMKDFTREFVTAWGFEKSCVGIVGCGLTYRQVFGGLVDPTDAIAQFSKAARAFIQETGAEVIVPGEMPLNVLLTGYGVSRIDDVPILDGLALTLMQAEMMVELKKRFGITHSRHGRKNAKPPEDWLMNLGGMYGLQRVMDHYDKK